jgi:hypothetical protein
MTPVWIARFPDVCHPRCPPNSSRLHSILATHIQHQQCLLWRVDVTLCRTYVSYIILFGLTQTHLYLALTFSEQVQHMSAERMRHLHFHGFSLNGRVEVGWRGKSSSIWPGQVTTRKAQPQQTMQRVLFSFSLRRFSDLIPGRHMYIYHSSSEGFMKLASSFFYDSPSLCSFLPWIKPSGPSASHRLDHHLISSNLFLPLRKDHHYENKNHGAFIGSSSFFQASRPRIF